MKKMKKIMQMVGQIDMYVCMQIDRSIDRQIDRQIDYSLPPPTTGKYISPNTFFYEWDWENKI